MNYKNILSKDKIYSVINGHQEYETDLGKILNDSFNFLFKDLGVQGLICFCIIILFFFLPFLLPFIMGGWYIYIHKKRHGGFATFSDIFLGFQHFSSLAIIALIQVFIFVLVTAILVSLGYGFTSIIGGGYIDEDLLGLFFLLGILLFLPFYYLLQIFFFFSHFFVIFSEMTASEALSASFSIAKKKFWSIFLIIFVSGLIAGLGINLCYIGFLFSYPFAFIASYIYFEQAFKIQGSEEDEDMDRILEHLV